jgi:hypothetical protein
MQGEAEPAFMVCGTIFLKAIDWGFFLEIWRIEKKLLLEIYCDPRNPKLNHGPPTDA